MKKQYRLLTVEDDEVLAANLNELLTACGYKVDAVRNGVEALRSIDNNSYDLIICDIIMNGMDGYTLLNRINERTSVNIPFIFLTAKKDLDSIRKGMNLGADDYIFKPYKAEEILNAIKIRIEKHEKRGITISDKKNEHLRYSDIIFINKDNKSIPIALSNIKFIAANEDYSNITTVSIKTLTVKKTLKEWEVILPVEQFIRIHRSTIVNINYIDKIEKGFNRELYVKIKGSEINLTASNRLASKLKIRILK